MKYMMTTVDEILNLQQRNHSSASGDRSVPRRPPLQRLGGSGFSSGNTGNANSPIAQTVAGPIRVASHQESASPPQASAPQMDQESALNFLVKAEEKRQQDHQLLSERLSRLENQVASMAKSLSTETPDRPPRKTRNLENGGQGNTDYSSRAQRMGSDLRVNEQGESDNSSDADATEQSLLQPGWL